MIAKQFTPEMQSLVSGFECGTEPFAQLMSEWIQGNKAVDSMQRGTRVWLFYTADGSEIIGFGSLGATAWRIPTQNDPPITVSIIPALAVTTRFHGQKPPDGAVTYARMILDFLIFKAVENGWESLVLYVDKRNEAAIRLYRKAGFALLLDSYKGNRKMFLDLSDLIREQDQN